MVLFSELHSQVVECLMSMKRNIVKVRARIVYGCLSCIENLKCSYKCTSERASCFATQKPECYISIYIEQVMSLFGHCYLRSGIGKMSYTCFCSLQKKSMLLVLC